MTVTALWSYALLDRTPAWHPLLRVVIVAAGLAAAAALLAGPALARAEFKRLVARHEIHYFVGANAHSFGGGSGTAAQITTWVRTHFRSQTVGGTTVYNLTRPLAGT